MFVKKPQFYFYIILILIFSVISVGCNIEKSTIKEKGITDNSIEKTKTSINSIKDGFPIAADRVKQWRNDMYLYYVNVKFNDEKQISERKGIITYFFYGMNVKDGLDAAAEVQIDMNSNSITKFSSTYGTSKELLGSDHETKVENWKIDIDDAVEAAMKEIGKDKILNHGTPNLIIRCWEKSWEIAVLSGDKQPLDDYRVELNPETGAVINTYHRKQ